ncbi:MAG TPA: hypothetical protein VFT45_23115 [Longimicrobium sp.]|nr:hypothetical protein [Longimicrobium sp.]
MPSSLTPSPSAARFGRRLLLALALCACGGGGDADDASPARTADATASAARAAGEDCPTPPAVDPARFKGPWDVLSRYLVDSLGLTFPNQVLPDSNTQKVQLCENCEMVEMTILPEATTYCTQRDSLNGGQRILGILVLRSAFTPSDSSEWKDPIQANDSIFMFASTPNGPATMVYRNDQGQAVVAPDSSWMFYYCPDVHRGNRPEAKWRPRNVPVSTTAGGPPAGKGKDEDDEENDGGGTYGWMACASGCCQFYTPPPNPIMTETPGQANEHAPDTVGRGRNRAAEPGKTPSWCLRPSAGT